MCRSFRGIMVALVALAFVPACRKTPTTLSESEQRAVAARYATLEFSRATKLPGLTAELQRIEQEGGLPDQLTARRTAAGASHSGWIFPDGTVLPDFENGAPVLAALFVPEELDTLKITLEHLYPSGRFEWDEKRLAAARELRRKFAEPLQRFERALERPAFELAIPYTEGFLADPRLVDSAIAANRLLAIKIAEQLSDRDPAAALATWPRLLILPSALTRAGNLTTLAAAARLRSEAFRILEVLVRRDDFDQATAEQLSSALEDHVRSWPADRGAWIGERAMALHAFEMVRAGELLSLLEFGRVQQLRRSGGLKAYGERVLANIDRDQLFYLEAVRQIADASDQPYRERRKTLDDVQRRLSERAGSTRYPAITGDLLWQDLEWGVRLQACDRALCGGWLAALCAAAGRPVAPAGKNPLTGAAYEVTQRGVFWEVRDIDLLGDQLQLAEEPLLVRVTDTAAEP